MTEAKAYELVSAIYALFGRQCPARTSPVVTAITTNTAEIPDTVSGYVYERFQLLDSLPQNMTKAILGAWETWKLENPRAVYRETCKQCGGNSGFDCWEKVTDDEGVETLHHFFAFCPACRKQREGHLYLTPRQWKERGVLVMPVGYKGGKLQFEADNGLRTVPEHNPHVLKSLKGLKLHMNRRTGYDRDLGLVSIHAPVRGATNN